MKIGLYIYKLGFGGAERVVCRTSQILSKNGHTVFIIIDEKIDAAYDYSGEVINLNIPHNIHGFKSIFLFKRRIKQLERIKQQYRFDCVISFLLQPNIVNILAKSKNTKTFVSIRNRFMSENYKSIFQRLFFNLAKVLYKKADGVISVSQLINNEAVKYLKVPKSKSYTLYNPYDIEAIKNEAQKTLDDDLKTVLEDATFKFVSTGRFTHQKGFWHLIKAFYKVHEKDPNTKLILIGDGEEKNQIVELIKKLNIEDSVCLPGFRKDVFAIEKYCNAYIMTSLFEGFPNALTEAMCLGLPIVSTDCKSGPKEILAPSLNLDESIDECLESEFGVLYPSFSNEENWELDFDDEIFLIKAMELIKGTEINKHYSEASKQRSCEFSEQVYYKKLLNFIYQSKLERNDNYNLRD